MCLLDLLGSQGIVETCTAAISGFPYGGLTPGSRSFLAQSINVRLLAHNKTSHIAMFLGN